MRYPAKGNALQFLKDSGLHFGTILDVGAQSDTPELRLNFPLARHILFEPAGEFHADLSRNYQALDHEIVPIALSDHDGVALLRTHNLDSDTVSHANLVGPDATGADAVQVARLETAMAGRTDPKPYLLKVDVDGLELAVLRGVGSVWKDIACVVLEATMESFVERLNFVSSQGFRLIDIVDQCYYRGVLAQVDLVFLAEGEFARPELRPGEFHPFAWEEWIPIAHFEPAALHEAAVRPIYGKRRAAKARSGKPALR